MGLWAWVSAARGCACCHVWVTCSACAVDPASSCGPSTLTLSYSFFVSTCTMQQRKQRQSGQECWQACDRCTRMMEPKALQTGSCKLGRLTKLWIQPLQPTFLAKLSVGHHERCMHATAQQAPAQAAIRVDWAAHAKLPHASALADAASCVRNQLRASCAVPALMHAPNNAA